MRFAFAGFDRWRGVFDSFIEAGWEPVSLFTVPLDNRLDFNSDMVSLAAKHKIPVQLSRISTVDFASLHARKCDALVVAGYEWRIPDWTPYLSHAINFHPSPLPEGRGPYPLIPALLKSKTHWGATCHAIDTSFDTGPILANENFPLQTNECLESLQLKVQLATNRLARRVAHNFTNLWHERRPQEEGNYWPRAGDEERTLNFEKSVSEILRIVRASGLVECLAPLNGAKVYVKRAIGWEEPHNHRPGEIVYEHHRTIVIAARDGFIGLVEWSPLYRALRDNMGP